ncbi:MAG: iron uptake porin [Synechococcales bacterium]|nr:iron uptake porin [Synechococcales bacterium]
MMGISGEHHQLKPLLAHQFAPMRDRPLKPPSLLLLRLGLFSLTLGEMAPALAEPAGRAADLAQLTSVSQLADVQPTDWAFQAVQSLAERYGCLSGYPDGSFRGDRPLTRYEFATGLDACLDRLNQRILVPIAEDLISPNDLATVQRLQTEFAAELAALQDQVTTLEARVNELAAQQFSTTSRLVGQTVFAVNSGGFAGDRIISPSGAPVAESDPSTTFIYRVALDINTSFTGSDLLRLRLGVGNGGARDNAAAVLEPNFGSGLDFSSKPPNDGNFEVTRLYYTFQPLPDLEVSIGPNIRVTDYVDRNRYANLSFRDFSTEALVNTLIFFPVNGPTAGAFADWNPGGGVFSLRALYAAADAANPGDQGLLRGTAPFARLLYPPVGNPATADLGDRGLFGDTYQGVVELEYAPANRFALRLQYGGGEVFDQRFDVLGINAEYAITPRLGVFGRYGYGRYTDTAFGDLNPHYWMAGIAAPNLFKEGALAGFALGQPFIETDIGNATQTNFEVFYNFPVSPNVRITPVLQIVTDAANQSENSTIITGTLRTVFTF